MNPLMQVRTGALASQGALTNNIGARPQVDPTALSDEAQPIQDTTELSPDAQRDLQASSAGSSGTFTAGVKQILHDMESIVIKTYRKDPNSAAGVGVRESNEIMQTLSNMSVSERQRVFRHLFMGRPEDAQVTPFNPHSPNNDSVLKEYVLKEHLSLLRARGKELLDEIDQEKRG